MEVWLLYLFCGGIILFSGAKLSKYGDIIAEKTGMGGTWIGVILMASVTSLPKLVTGISSVAVFNVPDIAAGAVLGSCLFNVFILSLLDIGRPLPISARAHQGHILSAGFTILLLGLVIFSILVGPNLPALGWIGPYSVVFLIIYFLSMRVIFSYEKKRVSEFIEELSEGEQYEHISKERAITMYIINALMVVASAIYLPHLGERIAEITNLGQTFVGNIFIAFSTSLPELVVTVAALRIGAVDMAVGNLFGSNLFNIGILAIDDIFYLQGPILSAITRTHLLSAISAITMTAIAIVGLTYRTTKKSLILAWDSFGIVLIYIMTILALYLSR